MKIIPKRQKNRDQGRGTEKTDYQKLAKEAMNLCYNSNTNIKDWFNQNLLPNDHSAIALRRTVTAFHMTFVEDDKVNNHSHAQ